MIDGYVRVGKLSEASNLLNMMPFKDVVAQTALINGYVQRMKMDEAHHIFREISTPDVVCWNTMISGYVQCGIMDEALELFMRMPKKDVVSWNTMIAGYAQDGQMDKALRFFHEMVKKNRVSWNSVISGFIQNGFYVEALQHFKMMRKEGKDPDWSTFACALSGCANLAALQVGTQLHNLLLKSGHIIDIFAGNALITMYARCGRILTARQVFDEMVSVDLVSWNSLIAGHALNGYAKAAISIFQEMKKNGVAPDEVTFIGLLSACSHAGMVDDGLELFYSMSRDYPITPVAEHYACVVDLLGRAGRLGEALKLVKGMPIKANAGIWGSLLGACRMHKNPEVANVAAEKLFEFEPHTTSNYVLLSNIHAEAGSWGEVERVRVLMKERGVWKQPARSWIEIKNEVRSFSSDDSTEPRAAEVFMVLRVLNAQMRNIGHMSDSSLLDCG
ncbi:PPR repeat [Musa troglodytarum]|nr:PPR repeat [Musa troglodytarum]